MSAGSTALTRVKRMLVKDGSKLACAIKKRFSNNMFSRTSNLYVCFYNERSDDVRWDYENAKDFNALPPGLTWNTLR
jgi:hypothetical protein